MAVTTIADPRITIRASEKLVNFIATLKNESSMPENVLKIYQTTTKDKKQIDVHANEDIPIAKLTDSELELISSLKSNSNIAHTNLSHLLENEEDSVADPDIKKNKKQSTKLDHFLNLNDIKWLNTILINKREQSGAKLYLHELLMNSKLILPKNEIIERNPVLEERCKKLRLEQASREYKAMTKNVDNVRKHIPEDTIAFQMKQINRHLIAVLQFIFSVAAGFAFGFIGLELMFGQLDFGFRLLMGIMFSLIIALAEIYFLAKKLNEEYDVMQIEQKNMDLTPRPKVHTD